MKLQAFIPQKDLFVIQMHEQEFEDLRSLIGMAIPAADSIAKESPQFRRAAHKLQRELGLIGKDAMNREKQMLKKAETE